MILSWMNIRRHFVSIMLMFCGLASSKGNRSFVRNYKDHDQRNVPIDAFIANMWHFWRTNFELDLEKIAENIELIQDLNV